MNQAPLLLTDADVDSLASEFLSSDYADNQAYSVWPLDRRLEGFLRRQGLARLAEDGDACNLILNRVMVRIGLVPRAKVSQLGQPDERPNGPGLRSLSGTPANWSDKHRHQSDFET